MSDADLAHGDTFVNGTPSTRPVSETMLNPIGDTIPWTCGVADVLGIDGFDTWTPGMFDGELPEGTDAVLIVGG